VISPTLFLYNLYHGKGLQYLPIWRLKLYRKIELICKMLWLIWILQYDFAKYTDSTEHIIYNIVCL